MGIYKSKIKNFKKYDVNCFQARSLLPEYTVDDVCCTLKKKTIRNRGIERILGYRNITEFGNTYEALKIKYALDDSKPLDISVGDDNEDGEEFDEDDYDPDPYAHCMHPDRCPSTCICACYNCNP